MRRNDLIERFMDWAMDAPMEQVTEMRERIGIVLKLRAKFNGKMPPLNTPEPRRGRPLGSKNKPREGTNGNSGISSSAAE